MLPDLGVENALLLQGPAGPFMRRFADELEAAGIAATKVNFHIGDAIYFRGPRAIAFRGRREEWPAFLRELIETRGIDGIFLFGDCRPMHRAAIDVARELRVAVWVFEEGYLRPDWITLERDGVNGYSRMPKDPAFYKALDLPEPEPPVPVGPTFGQNAWYSTLSALAFTHLNQGYPHYQHHRTIHAWYHTAIWVRNVFRKEIYKWRERGIQERLSGELSGRYWFVPLQVHCDFQLVHSPYTEMTEFIEEVLATFAAHADPDHSIVFKHHPMDRAYRDYTEWFRDAERRHGLTGRLYYIHDQHLPTVLKHARGTITINSTVGLSSIYHNTPVKTMGFAVYDFPGLTYQGSLRDFFADPRQIDRDLYERFRRYLIHTNQINGSFYRRLRGHRRGLGVRWFRGEEARHLSRSCARRSTQ